MSQVVVYESKKSRLARIASYCRDKYAQIGAGTTVAVMTVGSAHAADSGLDMTGVTDSVSGASSGIKGLFAAVMVVLGLFVAYRFFKRGANSA